MQKVDKIPNEALKKYTWKIFNEYNIKLKRRLK